MKLIRTEEAVGHVLCHDMTQIIKDQYKDARFRKGHIVTEEDIPVLLSMGKENLYVWEMTPGRSPFFAALYGKFPACLSHLCQMKRLFI